MTKSRSSISIKQFIGLTTFSRDEVGARGLFNYRISASSSSIGIANIKK